jgi:uncharacterized protein
MQKPFSKKLRPLLRALHRDLGYLAVGLTWVYAMSGIAVNHIAEWNPNFTEATTEVTLPLPLPTEQEQLVQLALERLALKEPVNDVYQASPTLLEVQVGESAVHIQTDTGKVLFQGQRGRFFFRVANWLHLNRGKRAWTLVADTYAVALLVLSLSGLFMIPGRKGLLGRGGLLLLLGAAIPIAYVAFSPAAPKWLP